MPTNHQTLSFTQKVNAPPKQVYLAFTNSTAIREWMSDMSLADPKPGGRLYLWWNSGYYASGEYSTTEPDRTVAFTWQGRGEPGETQVRVDISPQDGVSLVKLEHSGFGTGEAWSRVIEEAKKGWDSGLENLASVLETGEDLRFVRRPMLGIGVGEFNEEVAQKLGVPITKGIRLDGVVDGMGAKAAGLQADDVIVGMAGREVTDWASLTSILQAHHAGDKVEMEFYRGAEKRKITMELSRRPLPEIPATAQALAQEVSKIYSEMEARLEKFFEGVSEEEATHKPAPEEWSAKEVLAHLIHSERGWHSWISDLVSGYEPLYDDFGGNLHARVTATVAAYPTVRELLEEFKRNCTETVYLMAELPTDFLARKGSYWRIAYYLLDSPYHFKTHIDQMRAAFETSRKR